MSSSLGQVTLLRHGETRLLVAVLGCTGAKPTRASAVTVSRRLRTGPWSAARGLRVVKWMQVSRVDCSIWAIHLGKLQRNARTWAARRDNNSSALLFAQPLT